MSSSSKGVELQLKARRGSFQVQACSCCQNGERCVFCSLTNPSSNDPLANYIFEMTEINEDIFFQVKKEILDKLDIILQKVNL